MRKDALISTRKDALISTCGTYRYWLLRHWDFHLPRLCFVMLNPSTADASLDDPTIRRCLSFARAWGYGCLEVVNLYAYRTAKPREMFQSGGDIIGPDNDFHLQAAARRADRVICAWGASDKTQARAQDVLKHLGTVHHLGLTRHGHPGHPLYLKKSVVPVEWEEAQK